MPLFGVTDILSQSPLLHGSAVARFYLLSYRRANWSDFTLCASPKKRRSMSDLFVGFVFVVMLFAPAVIASMQWSNYMPAESEALSEDYSIPSSES